MLGRPEVVAAGQAGMLVGGAKQTIDRCRPLFAAIAGRLVEAGDDPLAATAIKIANNFVLGCAIEAMGEGFALIRKYGVKAGNVLRRDDRRLIRLLAPTRSTASSLSMKNIFPPARVR